MNAKVEDLLHTRWKQNRDTASLEDVVTLVRQGGGLGWVIITRHQQHPTARRRACCVRMLEHISAAVHAGTLAIPHAKHAIVFGARK